jgi:hypothetical protein
MRDLEGPAGEERLVSRHASGEINCVLRLEDMDTAMPVLCQHLTPNLRAVLEQKLPADGCWFLVLEDGRLAVHAASTDHLVRHYVPMQELPLPG